MSTHDPHRVIEGLRDQLARHDKPIAFFFGAGTSAAINCAPTAVPGAKRKYQPLIPAIEQLTDACKTDIIKLGTKFEAAWDAAEKECIAVNNVEQVLSRVRHKIDAAGPDDKLLGLNKAELEEFEKQIRKTIVKIAGPADADIPPNTPHDNLSLWIKSKQSSHPVEIFTSNYDILIERAMEARRVGVFDGFVGSFEPFFLAEHAESADLYGARVRLSKIHGSINWKVNQRADGRRIVRTSPPYEGEMILPSHRKYDESRRQPYLSLLARLSRSLSTQDRLLFACGYSFSDEHINAAMFDALDQHHRTHVAALMYGTMNPGDTIAKHAMQHKNLIVLARNSAVIGGRYGKWRLAKAVDQATSALIDLAFDSDANPENSQFLSGEFKLGDFNHFCSFLASMTSNEETS